MGESRGILFLSDVARGRAKGGASGALREFAPKSGAPLLPQAQEALWRLRQDCGWVCAAASGWMAALAIALAAQLPVDRLALVDGRMFDPGGPAPNRELAKLARYARRNLALVASEVLLIDATEREIRGHLRILGGGRLCAIEGGADALCAPWPQIRALDLLGQGAARG